MLRAYFDDSRHDRQDGIAGGIYLLAGYLGDATKWAQFADDWHAALHRGPRPLDFLKTHQAYRLDDPESMFYRWSPKERDDKLLLLAQTVNRHAMLSIQTIVRPEQYREIVGDMTGERVYYFLFFSVIAELIKRLDQWKVQDKIEIYFDRQGDESVNKLRAGFQEFIADASPEIKARVAEPEFKNDLDITPLQAADLIAWHVRRNIFERDRDRELKGPVWEELLNLERLTGIWDRRKLQLMAQQKLNRALRDYSGVAMTLPDPSSGWGWPWK
jgi:hypothetical protein